MFAAGTQDDFILPHHTEEMFHRYAGDKRLVMFQGSHNSERPEEFIE